MHHNFKSISRIFVSALALVLAFTILAPARLAYAQEEGPPQDAEHHGRWKARLSWVYQHELNLLERQGKRLGNTAGVVSKIEALTERANQKGLDPSALEAALAGYQATVAEARAENDEAAEVLRIHAGFDDEGVVTNLEEAVRTVNQARKSLTQAHRLLEKAGRALRIEVRRWINQQRSMNNAG